MGETVQYRKIVVQPDLFYIELIPVTELPKTVPIIGNADFFNVICLKRKIGFDIQGRVCIHGDGVKIRCLHLNAGGDQGSCGQDTPGQQQGNPTLDEQHRDQKQEIGIVITSVSFCSIIWLKVRGMQRVTTPLPDFKAEVEDK